MKKSLSFYLLLSLATQPLLGMQATPPQSSITGKTFAAIVGISALAAATIAYLLLTKSDNQVCKEFMRTVGEEVDALQSAQNGYTTTNVFTSNIPPFFSSEHSIDKMTIYSHDSRYRADITHRMTKKDIRHIHEFSARCYRNTIGKRGERLESKRG